MKRKLLFFILVLFIIFNFLDYVTHFYVLEYESNPYGSGIMLIGKIFVTIIVWLFYLFYNFENIYLTYIFSSLLIVLIWVFFYYGFVRNLVMIIDPGIITTTCEMLSINKTLYYKNVLLYNYVIPFTLSIISFIVYRFSVEK